MADSDPYSRHYWRLVDDPKFTDIYGDDHHYATWSRLLMLADQAWPASAHIPASARRASVAKLAEVGLVELLPGGRFRMHGTQAERERRAEHARAASIARWSAPRNAPGIAPGIAQTMPSRAEHRKAEQVTVMLRASDVAHELRVTDKAYKALLERFRFTGKWTDDRWPEPAWDATWGARP